MLSLLNFKYGTADALSLGRRVGGYLNVENQLTNKFLRNAENSGNKMCSNTRGSRGQYLGERQVNGFNACTVVVGGLG